MSQHQIVIPTKDKLFNLGEFSLRRPGNMITAVILVVGFVLTFIRFTQVSAPSPTCPIPCPGACGSASTCSAACVWPPVVTSPPWLLRHGHEALPFGRAPRCDHRLPGLRFVVFALLYDLGHPLRLPYMFFFPGTTSVLFEVGLCVATYLTVLFIEFSVAPMEWLSCKFPFLKKWRKVVVRCTIILTIFGVCLSTLHQSSLGAST